MQLTCGMRCCCRAVPGGDFFVGKRFFLESRSQAIDAQFVLFEEEFFGKPRSWVMRWVFFLLKNKQKLSSRTRCCCHGAAPGGDFSFCWKKIFLKAAVHISWFEEEFF